MDVHARFARHTAVLADEDACWEWKGRIRHDGYGAFSFGGKYVAAHRFSYATYVAPIPPGLFILHRCDNKLCVRPAHLYAGDQAQNMRDKAERGRSRNGYMTAMECKHGHPLSGDNIRLRGNERICRACERRRTREYQLRRKANP